MKEAEIQRRIRLATGRDPDSVLWRNNVGVAQFFHENIQRVEYGLCPGSSDLIGLTSVLITPAMVGQTVGRFVGLEIKQASGALGEKQRLFRALVNRLGGYADVVRGEVEATLALKKARSLG